MKTVNKYYRVAFVLGLLLLAGISSFAQGRRNGRDNRYHQRYNSRNHYYARPYYPAYRYNYRPAYRPYYRPVYRTAYRPIYRPIYRMPRYVHYGPSFGVRINVLPFGYSRIMVGTVPYFYSQGVYYRNYSSGGYEVAAPPLGAIVSQLPPGAKRTTINGQDYYELGGTFYQEEGRGNYRVVGADGVLNTYDEEQPVDDDPLPLTGSRFEQLPPDSKPVVINQQKLYVSPDGVYYQEVMDNNRIVYEVAGSQQQQ